MSDTFTQGIHWVSGQDKQAKRNARGHLMRELLRKKQWARKNPEENSEEPAPSASRSLTLVHTPWKDTKQKEEILVLSQPATPAQTSHRNAGTEEVESIQGSSSTSISSNSVTSPTPAGPSPTTSFASHPSPICLLQSNSDPFDTIPSTPLNSALSQEIFNATNFKTLCATIWDLDENASFNPLRDVIYPASAQDPVSFGPMLSLTASVRGRFRQTPVEEEALHTKVYSIHGVAQRLRQGPSVALSDATLVAVLGLCVMEAQFGDQLAVDAHVKGLQQLINQRGGFDDFSHHLQLFFGIISMLSYPLAFTLASMSTSSDPKYSGAEATEPDMRLRRTELFEFCKEVEHCLRSPLSVLGKRSETLKSRMFIQRTIARSSMKKKGQGRSSRYHDQCRFAALAYTHMLILEQQSSPSTLQSELDIIIAQLRSHKVHLGVSSDILVWLLNQSPKQLRLRDKERTWRLSRMMSIIKQLTDQALLELIGYFFDALEGKTSRSKALRDFWVQDDTWTNG